LGYFRTNPGQNTQQKSSREFKLAHLGWIALILAGQRVGKLHPQQAVQGLSRIAAMTTHAFGGVADMAEFCALLPGLARGDSASAERFLDLWRAFVPHHDASTPSSDIHLAIQS
jgi:hypothetical protein